MNRYIRLCFNLDTITLDINDLELKGHKKRERIINYSLMVAPKVQLSNTLIDSIRELHKLSIYIPNPKDSTCIETIY